MEKGKILERILFTICILMLLFCAGQSFLFGKKLQMLESELEHSRESVFAQMNASAESIADNIIMVSQKKASNLLTAYKFEHGEINRKENSIPVFLYFTLEKNSVDAEICVYTNSKIENEDERNSQKQIALTEDGIHYRCTFHLYNTNRTENPFYFNIYSRKGDAIELLTPVPLQTYIYSFFAE